MKKDAKLSAKEIPGVKEGKSEEDLRCKSLFTVCHRCLGLSEDEETRLEKKCFLAARMRLWYWLHKDLKEDQSTAEWVRFQRFSAWRTKEIVYLLIS